MTGSPDKGGKDWKVLLVLFIQVSTPLVAALKLIFEVVSRWSDPQGPTG
ncbi:hypothetical protein [Actinomadura yumaensis]|uniref:Uncharacterized protein n=1 Tax=Actinomadura yumaensis TaxID=111807 RepID=A0ABW2CQX7_9ACTN